MLLHNSWAKRAIEVDQYAALSSQASILCGGTILWRGQSHLNDIQESQCTARDIIMLADEYCHLCLIYIYGLPRRHVPNCFTFIYFISLALMSKKCLWEREVFQKKSI